MPTRAVSLSFALAFALISTTILPNHANAQECVEAEAWVRANTNQLPTTYNDFSQHSMAYRKAIFAALPPEARSALWRQHFEHYLAAHPGLDEAQTEFIQELIALAAPSLFAKVATQANQKGPDFSKQKEAAVKLFGTTEATLLLATLGPQEKLAGNKANCTCNTIDDWCVTPTLCTRGTTCTIVLTGCGSVWLQPCNGDCLY
ncbi:bacteriocin fulvocin C-related protein [Myxococcus sp. K15C18031901]|uniref:bacteriocin fulvocin C-related protein n=1 Tax=Myxococcus dinghuensis TaxID=2906761 RepID=UPI0020A6E634|nr:bacteriocin fulvocin C-related protein [Myxococcus dinghuensis]MCP3104283.1 bacteriocin fulvocin C-related protein [Myxococcus dinghuensis]